MINDLRMDNNLVFSAVDDETGWDFAYAINDLDLLNFMEKITGISDPTEEQVSKFINDYESDIYEHFYDIAKSDIESQIDKFAEELRDDNEEIKQLHRDYYNSIL